MRKMRKPIALLLAVLMLISAVPVLAFAEDTATESSITWSFDDTTGTLTISGTGKIPDVDLEKFDSNSPQSAYPWGEHLLDTKAIVIEEGITEIGIYALGFLIYAKTVSLPSTLKTIGPCAFCLDVSVKELIIPEGVTALGDICFCYMWSLENLVLPEGLSSANNIFGEALYLDSLTIPSTMKSFDRSYVKVFDSIYNKSDDVVINTSSNVFTSNETKEERYRYHAEVIAGYDSLLSGIEDEEEYDKKCEALLVSVFNEDCGTSFETSNEIGDYIDSLDGSDSNDNLTVYCNENSAQHDLCAKSFQKHVLFGSETEHTACFTMSGDDVDSNGNSFSYAINAETRTLTLNATGELYFDGGDLPAFSDADRLYDKVVIGEGITKVTTYEDKLFGKFTDLQLPSTYSDSKFFYYILKNTGVENITVAPDNTNIIAIDNVLYEILDSETLAGYKTQYGVDEIGDLALVYYPKNRTELNLSERTAIIKFGSISVDNITELAIPDSVVFADLIVSYNNSCNKLKKIKFGSNLKDFNVYEHQMTNLCGIEVPEENTVYASKDGVLYSKDLSTLILYPAGKTDKVLDLPETVTKIKKPGIYGKFNEKENFLEEVYIRNKDCEIEINSISSQFIIHGYLDSTAETYTKSIDSTFVAIETKEVESIAIKTMPTKTTYSLNDSPLRTNGLVITVTFTDGTTVERNKGFLVTGYDSSKIGTQSVTVNYSHNTSCTFDINVIEKYIVSADKPLTVHIYKDNAENIYFNPTDTAEYKISVDNEEVQLSHWFDCDFSEDAFCPFESNEEYRFTLGGNSQTEGFTTCTITVEKRSHTYNYEVKTPATCTQEGLRLVSCETCSYTAEEVIPIAAHTPGEWQISSAATCKKEGSKVRKCTECGETVESQKIAKTAHSMSAWNETAAPTCTEAGSRVRTCIHCGYKETEAVAATGHTDADNDGTCDTCGTDLGTNPAKNCSHLCHKTSGIQAFFWKIINFFNKLFKINQDCECGAKHW